MAIFRLSGNPRNRSDRRVCGCGAVDRKGFRQRSVVLLLCDIDGLLLWQDVFSISSLLFFLPFLLLCLLSCVWVPVLRLFYLVFFSMYSCMHATRKHTLIGQSATSVGTWESPLGISQNLIRRSHIASSDKIVPPHLQSWEKVRGLCAHNLAKPSNLVSSSRISRPCRQS